MEELSRTLQDVPLTGLIPVGLLVLVGLILWGAGQRVLRAGLAATGFLVGGAIGWLIGDAFNLGVPAWAAGLFCAVAVACLAALTYRVAVAGALAMVFAVGCPLLVITVSEFQQPTGEQAEVAPEPEADQELPEGWPEEIDLPESLPEGTRDEIDAWLDEFFREEIERHLPRGLAESQEEQARRALIDHFDLGEDVEEHFEQIRSLGRRLIEAFRQTWQETPESLRPMLLGAGALGALLGVLIGALVPQASAALVTAFAGSLLWLTGVRVIAERLTFAEAGWLPATGQAWLMLWIIVGFIGLAVQWTFLRPRADKSRS